MKAASHAFAYFPIACFLPLFLTGCFSPDPGRDDVNDSYDQSVGVYPQQILGMVFDDHGDLHLQVEYVHAYKASRPDYNRPPVFLRNYEIRHWTRKNGNWTESSLKNLSPYHQDFGGGLSNSSHNSLSMDENGRIYTWTRDEPWIKFLSFQNGEWRTLHQRDANFFGWSSSSCGSRQSELIQSPADKVYEICTETESLEPPSHASPGALRSVLNMWSGNKLSATLIQSEANVPHEFRVLGSTFHADTLNVLVVGDTGTTWVRAIPRPSLKSLEFWEVEKFRLDSNCHVSQFQVRKEGLVANGTKGDSVGWWSWKNQKSQVALQPMATYENFMDESNCVHAIDGSISGRPTSPKPLEERPQTQNAESEVEKTVLVYANSCHDAMDTLTFATTVPQSSDPYSSSYANHIFILNADGQPWLINSLDASGYAFFTSHAGENPEQLISTWRKGFRFDLMRRGTTGWEKVALPF